MSRAEAQGVEVGGRYRVRSGTGNEVVTVVRASVNERGFQDGRTRYVVRRERDGYELPKLRRAEDLLPLPPAGATWVSVRATDAEGEERRIEGTVSISQFEELVRIVKRGLRPV